MTAGTDPVVGRLQQLPTPRGRARRSRSPGARRRTARPRRRETSNGQAVLEDRPPAVPLASAAWQASNASFSVPPRSCTAPTSASMTVRKCRVCATAASTSERPRRRRRARRRAVSAPRTPPRGPGCPSTSPGGRRRRCRARRPTSTRSPANRICWRGSHATRSPSVCPRPQYCRTRSPRSPPRSIVSRSENVRVGQVSPGIDAGSSNNRGIRPYSDSQSCLPRSTMRSRVRSWATITVASNAAAPSTRTAW